MYYNSFKEFLISSSITFVATFALAFLPFLGNNSWSISALSGGALVAARLATIAVFQGLSRLSGAKLK